ncbi:hypothetical protein M8T12_21600 [Enterobacter ludwigii]|uniref:hypothetical protein n=1 Tax=Enterobacter ludwigii TaxID=299767 RepID=UPI001E3EC26B|nr:hypothetical protein [Enterobacter ludwigii]MCM7783630.1 hypothetical protein [Enterobacter ludwigii]
MAGLIARLKQYPPDALCMGTFWLEDDFLSLDGSLSEEEIAEAMRICDHSHDAGIGFNWDTLQFAIDHVNRYRRMSVPSALLPPAGGVFNAVPSR